MKQGFGTFQSGGLDVEAVRGGWRQGYAIRGEFSPAVGIFLDRLERAYEVWRSLPWRTLQGQVRFVPPWAGLA